MFVVGALELAISCESKHVRERWAPGRPEQTQGSRAVGGPGGRTKYSVW